MAKKHKKKIYTKPKKLKHVHENISINKFINSINNPRCQFCESILAIHANRNYCGKCETSENI